ncbi:MAG: gamma-glutamyl-gamma-aminobutyrate hydrolase family protein, partial [Kofleriaceae bacterium]|nr:gamma-glutamyl-gamma-aminobutyrate hydrolase family protein [Kofleriaceae bacterium]
MARIPKSAGTRVLLIDNYSSFSYNLLQYLAQITELVPTCLRNDDPLPEDLSCYDCVVISPGPGTPERASDMGMSRYFLEECRLPVLGICLGHQGLAYAFGTPIVRCQEPVHGRQSQIEHEAHPLFAGIPRHFKAVRYHSLAVEDPLPGSLESIARSEDGTIMAIAHRQLPKWGVQFHPESMQTEFGHLLLKNFCEMSVAKQAGLPSIEVAVVRETPSVDSPIRKRWTLLRHALPCGANTRELYTRLFAGAKHSFWLDGESCEQGMSYMGDADGAGAHVLRYDEARNFLVRESGGRREESQVDSIFDYLAQELAGHKLSSSAGEMAFRGGYVGYFGYELGRETRYESENPDAQWIWVDRFLAFDHQAKQAFLLALVPDGDSRASTDAEDWFASVEQTLATKSCPRLALPEQGEATPVLVMRDN